MNQDLINQLKGLPFSSYVFQLTVNDDPLLPRFLQTMREARLIRKRVEAPIEFMPALVMHKGEPSIFPNTISLIQGQSGVHKSGLAQLICACLIKNPNSTSTYSILTQNEILRISSPLQCRRSWYKPVIISQIIQVIFIS
jgi:hypothetical protein